MDFKLEVHDKTFDQIIFPQQDLHAIATGFRFLEGPVWHPRNNTLIFSDIMANGLFCRDASGTVSLFRENSFLANGNTYDRSGRLITCEHGTSRVTRQEPDGTVTVLASHYQERQLNSPNDVIVARDGAIFFTDPNPGRMGRVGIPRDQDLPFQGVFRIAPDGGLSLVSDDFSKPNGLCLSLDETHLFVNDTDRGYIRCFDLGPDGSVSGGDVWAELYGSEPGVADGMKFDSQGRLFCAGPGGIQVFDGQARLLGRILMPEVAANFTWGDADLRSLYITATTSLYRLRVNVAGNPLF